MKPAALSQKMNGGTRWNIEEIVALIDAFEVSFDYLIGRLPIETAEPVKPKTPAEAGVEAEKVSAPSRDRTYDLRIKSP